MYHILRIQYLLREIGLGHHQKDAVVVGRLLVAGARRRHRVWYAEMPLSNTFPLMLLAYLTPLADFRGI